MTTPLYDPIPIHVTGTDLVDHGERRRKVVTNFHTLIVKNGDTDIYPVVPQSSNRRRTVVIPSAGAASGAQTTAYGWLSPRRSLAQQQVGTLITAASSINYPFETDTTEALWFSIDPGAGHAIYLSIIEEYEVE